MSTTEQARHDALRIADALESMAKEPFTTRSVKVFRMLLKEGAGAIRAAIGIDDDDPPEADDYDVGVCTESEQIRIFQKDSNGAAICQLVLPADDAYDLAQRILKGYDRISGVK